MSTLFRPSPLYEELDRGYLGRIMRVNGFQSEKDTVTAIIKRFGLEYMSRRELSCLELLSLMANRPLEEFAQYHSTIPIRRAITSSFPDLTHGSPTRRSLLCNFGMVAARPGAYFCAKCVSDDEAFHGVSYWRRDHQVPGQHWCSKHLTALVHIKDDDAFLRSPSTCHSDVEAVAQEWVVEAKKNKNVTKFLDIASGLFERTSPIGVKFVSFVLKKRALCVGLNAVAAPVRNKLLLSDLICDSFPASWLAPVFPSLIGKARGEILHRIDGVLYMTNSSSSVWSYILAAAVLYDTADEALDGLFSAQMDFQNKPERNRQKYKALEKQELITAYIESQGHHAQVANQLNLPLHQVIFMLRKVGLPNLLLIRSGTKNLREAAEAFYLNEKSFEESANAGGLTSTELATLLRHSGVEFKSTLLAMAKQRRPRGISTNR